MERQPGERRILSRIQPGEQEVRTLRCKILLSLVPINSVLRQFKSRGVGPKESWVRVFEK
jgi:hypothetical protein